jgi:hypothetical protein
MTRERARELLPIFRAYGEGKVIQVKVGTGEWVDIKTTIDYLNYNYEYRIKPEDEYVPFTYEDTLVGSIILSKTEHKLLIVSQNRDEVFVVWGGSKNNIPYKELLDCFTFIDGTNCGKKVK